VLIAADQHAGCCAEREEPAGVERAEVQGTGPDCLLVFQEALWGASNGYFSCFLRQVAGGCGWFVRAVVRLRGVRERRGGCRVGLGGLGGAERGYREQKRDAEADGCAVFGEDRRHRAVSGAADCNPLLEATIGGADIAPQRLTAITSLPLACEAGGTPLPPGARFANKSLYLQQLPGWLCLQNRDYKCFISKIARMCDLADLDRRITSSLTFNSIIAFGGKLIRQVDLIDLPIVRVSRGLTCDFRAENALFIFIDLQRWGALIGCRCISDGFGGVMKQPAKRWIGVVVVILGSGIGARAQVDRFPQPVISVEGTADGFSARVDGETLRVTVCGDSIVHVVASPVRAAGASPEQPWMVKPGDCGGGSVSFAKTGAMATLTTAKLRIEFSLKRGNLEFKSADGRSLLRESSLVPRTYEPVELNGEKTFKVTDRFSPDRTEGFYGLGQHQSGMFNYRGGVVELGQNNTDVAVPLLVSTNGYAVMWNTASLTYFDNRFPLEMKFGSMAGNAVDYYFLYGPEMDTLIHEYRGLTGHAPLFAKWAYGYFQSKDRYVSQTEILDVARRYRAEHIPIDGIVQDWFWWEKEGDPVFNKNFTDVPAELKELHAEHFHAMLSVWALFDGESKNYQELKAKGLEISPARVYDPTNPAARDFYWQKLVAPLFAEGWDAFWLDSAEPEEWYPHAGDAILQDKKMAIGSGAMYTNVFPMMHTGNVAEHWKETTQEKRVFLLTRSSFLGEQRNGATVWSGDVYSTNWGFQHQIAAGLNYALSGLPYWTTDIGGYWPPYDGASMVSPEYQELYARWFEFGAFCPVFRSHGHRPHNEIWTYDRVEPVLLTYDKLRYRMMPYVYSLAAKVTNEDYTMMRPLVMDWRTDERVRDVADEYMFGPAFLVSPVWKEDARNREVYLPGGGWYDFWTGERVEGGRDVEADAPLEKMPLYIRAGSIVPLGLEIEYANEKPDGPVELRVYRGADGAFDLYDDEGDSYRYEKGARSVIPIRWDESAGVLRFGRREGTYPGMAERRSFHVIWVGKGRGVGEAVAGSADATVEYLGDAVEVKAK
jgi:alpha-D-xyloside xylohydrolase